MALVFLGLFLDLKNVQLSHDSFPFYILKCILVALSVFIFFTPLPEVKAVGEDETEENTTSTYVSGKPACFKCIRLGWSG